MQQRRLCQDHLLRRADKRLLGQLRDAHGTWRLPYGDHLNVMGFYWKVLGRRLQLSIGRPKNLFELQAKAAGKATPSYTKRP
jgi:hypothetical protein